MPDFNDLLFAVDVPARLYLEMPGHGPIKTPDGHQAWIDLVASDSTAGRAADRAAQDRARALGRERTSSELEADMLVKIAQLTKAWFLVGRSGAVLDIPCTPENAEAFYSNPGASWVVQDVMQFVLRLGNYIPAPSTD